MPQPPITSYLAHENVKALPFLAQQTFRNAALAAAGTFVAEFDVSEKVTEPNSFLTGAFPNNTVLNPAGSQPQVAVGPLLDVGVFTVTTAGSVLIEFAIDLGCTYRTVTTTVIPIAAFTNVSGLRVTARFVRITYTNTGGVASSVEFGAYIRST